MGKWGGNNFNTKMIDKRRRFFLFEETGDNENVPTTAKFSATQLVVVYSSSFKLANFILAFANK